MCGLTTDTRCKHREKEERDDGIVKKYKLHDPVFFVISIHLWERAVRLDYLIQEWAG